MTRRPEESAMRWVEDKQSGPRQGGTSVPSITIRAGGVDRQNEAEYALDDGIVLLIRGSMVRVHHGSLEPPHVGGLLFGSIGLI